MAAATIDEAVRKVLAVGGDPGHLGGVDNFCWPTIEYHPLENPDGKYKAAQLVRANWALRDYCLAFGIPLLSGKDSMYIDGHLEGPFGERRKVSGLPTLLFTVCSVMDDVTRCTTLDAKFPGDRVYVVGETRDELGASEYYQMMEWVGRRVPSVDAQEFWPHYVALHKAMGEGLVSSCHAVSRGGLATHLALVAMGGELGMEIHLPMIPAESGLTPARILFSESCGRFILTVSPHAQQRFEALFSGLRCRCIGAVTESDRFVVKSGEGDPLADERLMELKTSWKAPFEELI
jgi:phosphoribosylformylglycinamidine synthase